MKKVIEKNDENKKMKKPKKTKKNIEQIIEPSIDPLIEPTINTINNIIDNNNNNNSLTQIETNHCDTSPNNSLLLNIHSQQQKGEVLENTEINILNENQKPVENVMKKRGRKPKGGKLKMKQPEIINKNKSIANIILHLKCSLNDLNDYNDKMSTLMTNPLKYNPNVPPDILTYNNDIPFCPFEIENTNNVSTNYAYNTSANTPANTPANTQANISNNDEKITDEEIDNVSTKDINIKLKKIKINLYKNLNMDKTSACFWCTYDYDNPPCYIPKYDTDEVVCGYGSFCRPECAVAYLMKENIDDSTKFERYFLLNKIYSKVYNYKKNIKPAPNPYYLLEKFYGSLTIQEYRKLLKTEHMLLIMEKPMTRILPELHEDNEDIILNIRGNMTSSNNTPNTIPNTSGIYKVKRQSEKPQGPSKTSIIKDRFGLQ
jgi:hypothetical protein